ncbi:MAG: ABC transporter ATP-binding protein, partial [Anaerolineaceae bacterium]
MNTPPTSSEFTIPLRYETDRRSPVRWIWSHTIQQWWLIVIVLLGAFGNAALAAVAPMLTGQAFNTVLQDPSQTQELLRLALLIGGSQVIRGILQFGRNFGSEVMAQRMEKNIRNELYSSLLGKSMTFHSLQPVGDTMARATNDVREVNFLFSPGLNMVIGSFLFLLMPIALAGKYHPSLIIIPLVFLILYVVALTGYLKVLHPITDAVRETFGKLNSRLAEALDGIEIVKASAQEDEEVSRFKTNARRFRDASVRQGDVEARFIPLMLYGIALALGLLHALLLFRQGLLNIGDVVGYFGLLMMLDFPTFASLRAYSQVSSGLAGARRILDLINRETDLDQNAAGYHGSMKGEVEFRDVSFRYSPDDDEGSIQHVSFVLHSGQTVAVVGQTGSGKTTLARLVNRTYDVTGGTVSVDGRNVCDWNLETLRRSISIIEQDIFLFSRTIAENISFGRPGATREEITAAAQAAQADEFINELPEGYETVIGERGVTLSGGQRQRLALARAFLTDPRILILDDSTSAIDSATEDH